jgi:hypothetical protein
MAQNHQTHNIVTRYFDAWTTQRCDEAFALLADNLEFSGPTASYKSAAEFRPALDRFAAMTRSAKMLELVVEGNRAAMLYHCELMPPIGALSIASFFHVEEGKIRKYDTQFDATEFRKLLAQKSAQP